MQDAHEQRDFFISYNNADKAWAEWIAWELEEANFTTIIPSWDFRPGANLIQEINTAIQEAQRTILVLSPDYLEAHNTQATWTAAFNRNPNGILPVQVRECKVEGLLGPIIPADLVECTEAVARRKLLAAVRGDDRRHVKPLIRPVFPGSEKIQHTVTKPPTFPGQFPSGQTTGSLEKITELLVRQRRRQRRAIAAGIVVLFITTLMVFASVFYNRLIPPTLSLTPTPLTLPRWIGCHGFSWCKRWCE